jgi:hypothetical protein
MIRILLRRPPKSQPCWIFTGRFFAAFCHLIRLFLLGAASRTGLKEPAFLHDGVLRRIQVAPSVA